MKRYVLSTLFIMLTFVACEFTETIDESILPKGNAHDLGCDINIVESAYRIIGLSKEKAASYLKEAGWQQLTADSNTFICKDSSMVKDLSSWKGEYKPGPRTTMDIYLDNGIVTSSNLACYCYPEDKPFHQLAEWDAWNIVNGNKLSISGVQASALSKEKINFIRILISTLENMRNFLSN